MRDAIEPESADALPRKRSPGLSRSGLADEEAIFGSLGVVAGTGVSVADGSARVTLAAAAPLATGDAIGDGAAGLSADLATGLPGNNNWSRTQPPISSKIPPIPAKSHQPSDDFLCGGS